MTERLFVFRSNIATAAFFSGIGGLEGKEGGLVRDESFRDCHLSRNTTFSDNIEEIAELEKTLILAWNLYVDSERHTENKG